MNAEVVVVGAGPIGLLLAGDLAQAGIRVTLVERRTEESPLSRAFAVHARTMEVLDMRGLAEEVLATGRTVPGLLAWDHVMIGMAELPGRFPYMLITPQYEIERLLLKRALEAGVHLLAGHAVTGLQQGADDVSVHVRTPDREESTLRALYVVGADGRRSVVREAAGIAFPGHAVTRSMMLADVRLTEEPKNVLSVNGVREGFVFIAPFGDGWYRVICYNHLNGDLPDEAPVDLEELKWLTGKAYGTDFGMHSPRWMSRFHSDERQAASYRAGRVFVAGDAAHVHVPAGGQGMNTGLQDAANLSWKLVAAVRGWARPGLLDTYDNERHPVGRAVLRTSGIYSRMALLRSPFLRTLRNRISGTAMRITPIRRAVALNMLSGISHRYAAPEGAHPWVGRRVPDFALDGAAGRLYEALRGGRFVLSTPLVPPSGWSDRVEHVIPADRGMRSMLIRPDGHLAWAGDGDLARPLADWCGPAS
ncbi:FAD-dependent monooxygenase [Nonomuraea angiospora]|uniref:2-polyprenyl-6-methoxyphenol hydroxylase-like FAD-dependent oxidoreductase n=1 Tax=Nonomuraea angiospora TaxID=46172 RepID=A0ABR9LT02_9ACTN|nr:FAD-dependent monooxygenase [Nonomuraea angiospora]MBE1583789.1 2-polyprenyl-6-methoxyphenol hydroxylase-like FAD-dependent oxidoreductase [Nonomuraea angiospora]